MPDLWVPGFAGPLDDLVDRIHRRIEEFAQEHGVDQAYVEVEFADGSRYAVEALTADPGYGFVTLRPYGGDDVPGEMIVAIGSIRRIELSSMADRPGRLGFSPPGA